MHLYTFEIGMTDLLSKMQVILENSPVRGQNTPQWPHSKLIAPPS